ncbi:MAG: 3-hydroxyacyl-CoA dehydrogenase family protein [Thermoanaerobaculia bacterium]
MLIRQISVLGSGTMGRGIAYLAATAGYDTVLHDLDEAALALAREHVHASIRKGVEKGKLDDAAARDAVARLRTTTEIESAVIDANLIIEAIPENIQLKKDLYSQADLYCAPDTIFATNTSSLPISQLAGAVEKRDRFIGMHFFNPPEVMRLVEIVVGERTSDATVEDVSAVVAKMGREAIVVRDTPGFATSRLGVLLGLEAIRMLQDGIASAEDIDKAMVLGYNHPMGPLRLTDLIGLDVRLSIAEHLAATLGPRFDPPALLRAMVREGRLGRKTGSGFYQWETE